MTALELLRRERSALIRSESILDRETHEPIQGTMDPEAVAAVAEYDAAIAEVEGMAADNARLHKAVCAFVAWLDAEDGSPDYGVLSRDTHPEGERIWKEWFDRNIRLCDIAQNLGHEAIAKARGQS